MPSELEPPFGMISSFYRSLLDNPVKTSTEKSNLQVASHSRPPHLCHSDELVVVVEEMVRMMIDQI